MRRALPWTRLCWLLAVGLALASASNGTPAAEPSRPNVVLILADDLGIPGVGCYGGSFATPHLGALAAGGTRFEHCFAAPLCGPSRAMLLTGRYPFRTGVVSNETGARLSPDNELCLARLLRKSGYATAVAGKWRQLSHFTNADDGQRWGFDEFLIWGADAGRRGERYWDPDYNHNGDRLAAPPGAYGPDLLHEFVVDFIRRHRDAPFFLYYPTPLVHAPIVRTPDSPEPGGETRAMHRDRLYADNIAYLDALVGRLVAELETLRLRERTLILFVGDNGSVGGGEVHGRPIDGGKGTLREGGSRVPLIANWPGTTPEGVVCQDLIDLTDFFPTLAEVAGAELPSGLKLDGHSFAPQLHGQSGTPREWVYVQLGGQHYAREAGWKLDQDGQLFDMSEAPFAEHPVPVESHDGAANAARARLQAALTELRGEADE